MNAKQEKVSFVFLSRMLFLKFTILSAIILSLTLAHPATTLAHKGAHELCSFLMNSNSDCAKFC